MEHVLVGEVIELQRRPVAVDLESEYREVGVRSFGRGIFHKEPVNGAEIGAKRVFHIKPGDLVISNVFAWEGAVAVAGPTEAGMIGSHRFMTFTPQDERVDIAWLSWFLRGEVGLGLLREASPGSAGRNKTLAVDRFEALQIPLPAIEEQRRVAARLDQMGARALALLEASARAEELSSALYSSATVRLDLDDSAKLAAGWRRVPLVSVVDPTQRQCNVSAEAFYPIAGIYSFGRGLIDRGPMLGGETAYRTLTELRSGDIVFSKLNGWEGAIAVVEPPFDGYFVSPEYPTFVADAEQLLPAYFGGIARSPSFWGLLDRGTRGSMVRRRRVSPTEFLRVEIWLPPIEVQATTVAHLQALDDVATVRRPMVDRVGALVPSALNEAFAGLS